MRNDDPDNLYARVLENAAGANDRSHTPTSTSRIMYLGETFNLTHLLYQTSPNYQQYAHKLHYALPLKPRVRLASQTGEEERTVLELLRLQHAFDIPSKEICHELFHVYFQFVHPHYPILDRCDFAYRYQDPSDPPSYLLLQAVLFMAAGHCTTSLLHDAGLGTRYEARLTLFKRAKALYDADWESDQVSIVQALFLMSFWWNSLTDQKDTWYWLGSSISLAVTLGMHRSTRYSDLSPDNRRLWKRIWWSLFTEDKHAAAALGRPAHVRSKDCDLEPLDESDFKEEVLTSTLFGSQEKVHVSYAIALSELSQVLEQVVENAFQAQDQPSPITSETLQRCHESLRTWKESLPEELQFHPDSHCLWTNNLHIAHRFVALGIPYRLVSAYRVAVAGSKY